MIVWIHTGGFTTREQFCDMVFSLSATTEVAGTAKATATTNVATAANDATTPTTKKSHDVATTATTTDLYRASGMKRKQRKQ